MGWLSSLTSWLSNAFNVLAGVGRTITHWVMNRLYLLVIPLISGLKLIYDFLRELLGLVIEKLNSLGAMSAEIGLPDYITFVNAYFPIDTLFSVLLVLFTLWIGCLVISAIIKIKQAVLF